MRPLSVGVDEQSACKIAECGVADDECRSVDSCGSQAYLDLSKFHVVSTAPHFGEVRIMKRALLLLPVVMTLMGNCVFGADEPTADEYLNFYKFQVGKWTARIEGNEIGTATWEVSPNGRCLEFMVVLNGQPANHGLEGYDPHDKCWTSFAFYRDGGLGVGKTKVDAATIKAGAVGATLKVQWRVTGADGTKMEELPTSLKIVSKDKIEFQLGESGGIKGTLERVK